MRAGIVTSVTRADRRRLRKIVAARARTTIAATEIDIDVRISSASATLRVAGP
jgi:hypothetical protein